MRVVESYSPVPLSGSLTAGLNKPLRNSENRIFDHNIQGLSELAAQYMRVFLSFVTTCKVPPLRLA